MKRKTISIIILFCLLFSTTVFTSGCDSLVHMLEESDAFQTFSDSVREMVDLEVEVLEELEEENYTENYYIDEDLHYYFRQLSENGKKTYSTLLNGLMDFEEEIKVAETDEDALDLAVLALLYDHPEMFWFEGAYEYICYPTHITLNPTYIYNQTEMAAKRKEIASVTHTFLASVPSDASDYDKVKQVYDYVIKTVSYDDNATDNQNIYSSMVNKSTVCAGYAREVQYLLNQMDMECLYAPGEIVDADTHAWNIVKCDGKYYQLDATYGDRMDGDYSDMEGSPEEFLASMPEAMTVDYGYLCCTDDQLYTDHILDEDFSLPVCESNDLNYFWAKGTYYESYSDEIWSDIRESVYAGERLWECQFANEAAFEQAFTEIENEAYSDIVIEYLDSTSAYGEYQMWYTCDDYMLTISLWY